jgi:hypothetical protein
LKVLEITFQNGVLPIVAQGPWTVWRFVFCRLPLHQLDSNSMRPIYEGTKHKIFLSKRIRCCWNSMADFQHVICRWLFFLMVLLDSGISGIVLDDARFWMLASISFCVPLSEHGSCLGSKDLCYFDHTRAVLCLRVDWCVLIISTDPIT